MELTPNAEEVRLRETLRGHLRASYDVAARTAATRSPTGWRQRWWAELAREPAILPVGEVQGLHGCAGSAVAHMIVMEEFGRALVVEPYLETMVLGVGVLSQVRGARAAGLLGQVLAGHAVLAVAWSEARSRFAPADVATSARRVDGGWRIDGAKPAVPAAPWATHILVVARTGGVGGDRDGVSIFVVEAGRPGLVLHSYPTLDDRRAADILLDDVRVPPDALLGGDGTSLPLIEAVLDAGIAAASAEAVGVMRSLNAQTLAFLRQRRQFGRPLAEMQVLQHAMVDMYMKTELAAAAALRATLSLGGDPAARARAASAAAVTVGRSGRFVGQHAVQLHGALGTTQEHPVGHGLKRLMMIEAEFGTADDHLGRYAWLTRDPEPMPSPPPPTAQEESRPQETSA